MLMKTFRRFILGDLGIACGIVIFVLLRGFYDFDFVLFILYFRIGLYKILGEISG